MSTSLPTSNFRALRAWRRGDHLHQIRDEIANALTHGLGAAAALAGGVFYTLGTYFYHRESIPYAHAIWHLFVIAGSVCHFVAVAAQVV